METVRHRQIASQVISLEGLAIYVIALNAAHGSGPGDIAGNAQPFPFLVAGLEALGSKDFCLVCGYLVVCHQDAVAVSAIFRIQQIDGVERCAGASKKVNNQGIWLVSCKKVKTIFYGI